VKANPFLLVGFIGSVLLFASCGSIDVYEKTKAFPDHEWKSNDSATFTFDITDTTAKYNIYFVLRHEDAYRKKNIWVDIAWKNPDSSITVKREFNLADNTRWLGTAMDDIIEHRISVDREPAILKKGRHVFILKQAMREDPLQYVLNAGIRVEKAK
jgi:gliding motility-associated lipoprotein GldH